MAFPQDDERQPGHDREAVESPHANILSDGLGRQQTADYQRLPDGPLRSPLGVTPP